MKENTIKTFLRANIMQYVPVNRDDLQEVVAGANEICKEADCDKAILHANDALNFYYDDKNFRNPYRERKDATFLALRAMHGLKTDEKITDESSNLDLRQYQ